MKVNYTRLLSMVMLVSAVFQWNTASAQLSGWKNKIQIDIANKTATSRTNYQELVVVNTKYYVSRGQMKSDGSDIRFADKCSGSLTILPHFIMQEMNTDSTKIWVLMPSVPANSVTSIFMYFDSSSAQSTSSFSKVFPNAFKTNGPNYTLTGTQSYDWFEVESNDTIFAKQGSTLEIFARVIIVKGVLFGNKAGYSPGVIELAGNGPGYGSVSSALNSGAGGAGYGGIGGKGGYDAGDSPGAGGSDYGTNNGTDFDMGSSGGAGGADLAGYGGGAIVIQAEFIQFSGQAHVNGGNGGGSGSPGRNAGGGSGGALIAWGSWVKLGGTITANGGNGGVGTSTANDDGGGGGGGRIKVFHYGHITGSATYSVTGGAGGPNGGAAAGENGYTGTVYRGFHYFETDSVTVKFLQLKLSSAGSRICEGTPLTVTASAGFTNYTFYKNNSQLSSTSSNTYVYNQLKNKDSLSVVASLTGCFNAFQYIKISVDTLPKVSIVADAIKCEGDTLKMLAKGAESYEWKKGPKTDQWNLKVSMSDSFFVKGFTSFGCEGSAAHSLTVYTYPNYTVSGAGGNTVCEGDSVKLTASGANFIDWDNGKSTHSIYVKPSITSHIKFSIYDYSYCKIYDSVLINVNAAPKVYVSGKNAICLGETIYIAGNGAISYLWNTGGTNYLEKISPKVKTTYTVVGTDNNGCMALASKTVEVNIPKKVLVNGDMEICKGESTKLMATGSHTYVWNTGSTDSMLTVAPSVTANYAVIGTDFNGCSDTVKTIVNVHSTPQVECKLNSALDTLCINDAAWSLEGGTPTGGSYRGNHVLAGKFYPGQAGLGKFIVYYRYTDANSCTDSASAFIFVDICANTQQIVLHEGLKIFPNPVTGKWVHLQGPQGIYFVYAADGKIVDQITLNGDVSDWYTGGLCSGLYLIKHKNIQNLSFKLQVESSGQQ